MATDLFGYLHRLSWLLQQGTPVRPVKVYVPASDAYAAMHGSVNLYRTVRRLIGDDIPRIIRSAGLDFDLIDDDALSVVDPAGVPLVVVPPDATMPEATTRWLDAVRAAGGSVVSDPSAALPAAPMTAPDDVGVVHRRLDDGDVYFVANTGNETADGPLRGAGGAVGSVHRRGHGHRRSRGDLGRVRGNRPRPDQLVGGPSPRWKR